jgi:hypothetical protein
MVLHRLIALDLPEQLILAEVVAVVAVAEVVIMPMEVVALV